MFIEILIFLLFGIALGIFFGLAPGIHPNMIILLAPLLASLASEPLAYIALIVSMAITNVVVDFIPSILFGAPDAESALSILPGHKMLMAGEGYHAIKLAVLGSLGAIMFCIALVPLLIFATPGAYTMSRPYIPFILAAFVFLMLWASKKKILSFVCFMLAGAIGIISSGIPISSILILFPIFTGFFAFPCLLLQLRSGVKPPPQSIGGAVIEKRGLIKPVALGSLGGMVSGLLPGIGSSEIAGLATIDKNSRSFLATLGAIAAANTLLSLLALWIIGSPRSGAAVAVAQFAEVGISEFFLIIIVAVISAAVAVLVALHMARRIVKIIGSVDYSLLSKAVLAVLFVLIAYFTGAVGLFLALVCCALGLVVNLANIKRGLLMGVLILPTILFYLGF